RPASLGALSRVRQEAMSAVAEDKGVGYTAVQDACTRRLGLESTREFDALAHAWLSEGHADLRRCIEAHVGVHTAEADRAAVHSFFGSDDHTTGALTEA